jgi:hypothetical protein
LKEKVKKRYNSYVDFFRHNYGNRIQKIVVDAGFTCPNRDGTVSFGGCTYCNNDAFHPSYSVPSKSVTQQIEEGIRFHLNRYRRAENYLAYFQSYSNTYAPLERLKELYEEALSHPSVKGLVIGTRPDCVDGEKLDYLRKLSEKHIIIVEYGIESCYDRTLERINRGHNFAKAKEAVKETAVRGIHQGAHFIFGLPGETKEEMLEMTSVINTLPINSVKFHQLQIIKGTFMEQDFAERPEDFVQFGMEEYIDFFISFLERLRPDLYIERFAGEVPPRFVNSMPWGTIRNVELLRLLEKRLEELDTYQGRYFTQS